jgi:hypothetical protein
MAYLLSKYGVIWADDDVNVEDTWSSCINRRWRRHDIYLKLSLQVAMKKIKHIHAFAKSADDAVHTWIYVSREADADIHAVCPETYWYFLSALVDAHGYTFKNKLKR